VLADTRAVPPAVIKEPEHAPPAEPTSSTAVVGPGQLEATSVSAGPSAPIAPAARLGIGVQVGGGVNGFSAASMPNYVRNGGYWDARIAVGLRKFFTMEGAYVGTAHPLVAPGVSDNAALIGHGFEGDLRLNLPVVRENAFLSPYALVGLGWMHYHVAQGTTDRSIVAMSDDVGTIPVGGGVTIGDRHLYFDARVIYRLTSDEDLIVANPHSGQLRQWSFGGAFGYLF
jgi:hypothetical protein